MREAGGVPSSMNQLALVSTHEEAIMPPAWSV
jgi:hypothetical protein